MITAVNRNAISLAWLDNSNIEVGFYLERSLDGTVFNRIATLRPNTEKYKNTNLSRGTSYWYRIQAYNRDGVSEYSNTVSAATR